jgi:hypothetical protein
MQQLHRHHHHHVRATGLRRRHLDESLFAPFRSRARKAFTKTVFTVAGPRSHSMKASTVSKGCQPDVTESVVGQVSLRPPVPTKSVSRLLLSMRPVVASQ